MKKLLTIALILVMMLCIVACNTDDGVIKDDNNTGNNIMNDIGSDIGEFGNSVQSGLDNAINGTDTAGSGTGSMSTDTSGSGNSTQNTDSNTEPSSDTQNRESAR